MGQVKSLLSAQTLIVLDGLLHQVSHPMSNPPQSPRWDPGALAHLQVGPGQEASQGSSSHAASSTASPALCLRLPLAHI